MNEVSHSGFIAIVGRPNVGKSTLLNAILGEKLAIVSARPQTTRSRVTGIWTEPDSQVIFIDTPGLLQPRNRLGEYMVKTVGGSIADVDAAVLVVEPVEEAAPAEEELLRKLRGADMPTVLVINKIDTLADKTRLVGVIGAWSARLDFAAVVPLSAAGGDGLGELKTEILRLLPSGPKFYPDDIYTTDPERAIAAEIIREKLLRMLADEVPHGTAVEIEKMHTRETGDLTDIEATIYCEKESHKGIIIGKGGVMLKKIGTAARQDIEKMLGGRVNLRLWVKVRSDWRNQPGMLHSLGYD